MIRRADVAAAAGVAPTTVSLVLNRNPGVSIPEATRQRVFDAAARLGYRPSQVARALSSGRTLTVGVVIHHLSTPFELYTAGVLNGAWPVFHGGRYRLLIGEGTPDLGAANLFHEKCVDGLMVLAAPAQASEGELAAVVRTGFPAVLVGASLPGNPLDYVDVDNAGAAQTATEALLAAGHRQIAHISGPLAMSTAAGARLEGYRATLRRAGVAVSTRRIVAGDWRAVSGRVAAEALLRSRVPFTAIFAGNDGMANGAIEALRGAGLRVPQDVSVVGVDGFTDYPLPGVDLATVRQPLEAIGRAAAEILMARIGGARAGGAPRRVLLPGVLSVGATLAPPR